jgi:signal peptidase I
MRTLVGVAAAALAVAGAATLRRRWIVIRIDGASMMPALRHDDVVLVRRRTVPVSVGDIVVVEPPGRDNRWARPPARTWTPDREWIVKRVAAVPGDPVPACVPGATVVPPSSLIVLSDDQGLDSRTFGPLPAERLFGVVVRHLSRSAV